MDRMMGSDSNNILQSYTDILPGRPTVVEHRAPEDDLRRCYNRKKRPADYQTQCPDDYGGRKSNPRLLHDPRTTHKSQSGKKLYAVRDKAGKFKDIQSYKKAHGQDVTRKSQKEK